LAGEKDRPEKADLGRRLSLGLLFFAVLFAGAAAGFTVREFRLPPYQYVLNAARTGKVVYERFLKVSIPHFESFTDLPIEKIASSRVRPGTGEVGAQSYLMTGGPDQFREYCPLDGCLAVVLDRNNTARHVYPYRPAEFRSKRTVDLHHEQLVDESPADIEVMGLWPLAGGDLIVTFHLPHSFPVGGGTARVDPGGHVVWYRRDYGHHWPMAGANGEILVPTATVSNTPVDHPYGTRRRLTVGCLEGYTRDSVQILDQQGNASAEISVFDALMDSPFRFYLLDATEDTGRRNPCDPIHLNYVHTVDAEIAARFSDVAPDDLLVSLRSLSAVAIIDRRSHKMTHFFAGTFLHQHSAQPFGAKILLFDDNGASWGAGPSRVLLYDPVTRTEQVVFPGPATPQGIETFTSYAGNINVSADRKTALISVTEPGLTYEINIADGKVLTVIENLHDLSSRKDFSKAKIGHAALFEEFGVYYPASSGQPAEE
jgi:hypothetical protein